VNNKKINGIFAVNLFINGVC